METNINIKSSALDLENIKALQTNAWLEKCREIKKFESPVDLSRYLFKLFGQDPKKVEQFLSQFFTDSKEINLAFSIEGNILEQFGTLRGGKANIKKDSYNLNNRYLLFPDANGGDNRSLVAENSQVYIVNKIVDWPEISQLVKLFKNTQIVDWLRNNYFRPETAISTWLTVSLLNVAYKTLEDAKIKGSKESVLTELFTPEEIEKWNSLLDFDCVSANDFLDTKIRHLLATNQATKSQADRYNTEINPTLDPKQRYSNMINFLKEISGRNDKEFYYGYWYPELTYLWVREARFLPPQRLFADGPTRNRYTPTEIIPNNQEKSEFSSQISKDPELPQEISDLLQDISQIRFTPPAQKSSRLDAARSEHSQGWFEHEETLANSQNIFAERKLAKLSNQLYQFLLKQEQGNIPYSQINLTPEQDAFIKNVVDKRFVQKDTGVLELIKRFIDGFSRQLDRVQPNLGKAQTQNLKLAHYLDKPIKSQEQFSPENPDSYEYTTILYKLLSSLYAQNNKFKKPVNVDLGETKISKEDMEKINDVVPFITDKGGRVLNLLDPKNPNKKLVSHNETADRLLAMTPAVCMFLLNVAINKTVLIESFLGALASGVVSQKYMAMKRNRLKADFIDTDTLFPLKDIESFSDVTSRHDNFNKEYGGFKNNDYGGLKIKTMAINLASYIVLSGTIHNIYNLFSPPSPEPIRIQASYPNEKPNQKKLIAKILSGSPDTPIPNEVLVNNFSSNSQESVPDKQEWYSIDRHEISNFELSKWSDTNKYIVIEYSSIKFLESKYLPQGYKPKAIFYTDTKNNDILAGTDKNTGISNVINRRRNQIGKLIVVAEKIQNNNAHESKILLPESQFTKDLPKVPQMDFEPNDWIKYIPDNPTLANKFKDLHTKYKNKTISEYQLMQELSFVSEYPYEFNGLTTDKHELKKTVFEIANKMKEKGIVCNQANTLASVAYSLITGLSSGVVEGYMPRDSKLYDIQGHQVAFFVDLKGQLYVADYTPKSGPDANFADSAVALDPAQVNAEELFNTYTPHIYLTGIFGMAGFVVLRARKAAKDIQDKEIQKEKELVVKNIQALKSISTDHDQLPTDPELIDIYTHYMAENSPLPILAKLWEILRATPDGMQTIDGEVLLKNILNGKYSDSTFRQSTGILTRLEQGTDLADEKQIFIVQTLAKLIGKYDEKSFVENYSQPEASENNIKTLKNIYSYLKAKYGKYGKKSLPNVKS